MTLALVLTVESDRLPVTVGGASEVVIGPPDDVDPGSTRLLEVRVHAGDALAEAAMDVHGHRHRIACRLGEGTRVHPDRQADRADAGQSAGGQKTTAIELDVLLEQPSSARPDGPVSHRKHP